MTLDNDKNEFLNKQLTTVLLARLIIIEFHFWRY